MNIIHYQHAHQFLKDSWLQKREKNPGFSLRAWAKQMGMSTHTTLTLMLNGKRDIPKKYVPVLIKSLMLTAREGLYLEMLIGYNQSKTVHEKELYSTRLQELTPQDQSALVELETFRYLEDPIHCIIMDMTDLADFNPDPKWIQARLQISVSVQRIEEVIARLIKMQLLQQDENGQLKKTYRTFTSVPDVADLAGQSYHKNASMMAGELISQQSVHVREFNGYTMSIKKSALPAAKLKLREFARQFMQETEAPAGEGEETYQLNLQFFPITVSSGGKDHE